MQAKKELRKRRCASQWWWPAVQLQLQLQFYLEVPAIINSQGGRCPAAEAKVAPGTPFFTTYLTAEPIRPPPPTEALAIINLITLLPNSVLTLSHTLSPFFFPSLDPLYNTFPGLVISLKAREHRLTCHRAVRIPAVCRLFLHQVSQLLISIVTVLPALPDTCLASSPHRFVLEPQLRPLASHSSILSLHSIVTTSCKAVVCF